LFGAYFLGGKNDSFIQITPLIVEGFEKTHHVSGNQTPVVGCVTDVVRQNSQNFSNVCNLIEHHF